MTESIFILLKRSQMPEKSCMCPTDDDHGHFGVISNHSHTPLRVTIHLDGCCAFWWWSVLGNTPTIS